MVLEPIADGEEHPEPPEPIKLDIEQSYTDAEDSSSRLTYDGSLLLGARIKIKNEISLVVLKMTV